MMTTYVKSIVVLGLASSILSSQIPVIQWVTTANNPFNYFIPSHYSEYQAEPHHNPTHEIAIDTQLTSAHRSFFEKRAILRLREQIKELKSEMNTLKYDWDAMKTDFEQKIQQLTKDLEDTKSSVSTVKMSLEETNMALEATETDLNGTKSELEETKINLAINIANLDQTKTDLETLITRYNTDHSSSDNGMIPGSCSDLQAAGHKNSGIYLIQGSSAIESTYCNFKNPELDKLIGSVDVKSVPTYFYVQKSQSFSDIDLPIPFEVEKVNVGNAMDLTSGKFTAPRKGTYFFSFTCLGGFQTAGSTFSTLTAGLYLNNGLVGVGRDEEKNTASDTQHNQLTIQMTLNLEANDQVWIQFVVMSAEVSLHDHDHSTHFMGFMLEENIVASL